MGLGNLGSPRFAKAYGALAPCEPRRRPENLGGSRDINQISRGLTVKVRERERERKGEKKGINMKPEPRLFGIHI